MSFGSLAELIILYYIILYYDIHIYIYIYPIRQHRSFRQFFKHETKTILVLIVSLNVFSGNDNSL